jgi:putative intracellular protease/amidase
MIGFERSPMAQPKRVLIPMSSHDDMGISGIKTGSWFEEVATPYYEFLDAGFQVVFASPKGGRAPIDALSMQAPFTTANTDRFLDDPVGMRAISHTAPLQRLDGDVFDALFFPGGYGLLWDLASDSQVIRLIERFVAEEKPVAMVCHAPGILRDAKASNGAPLVKGHRVTGFTNAEDDELDLSRHLLFSLEDELKAKGASYVCSEVKWAANVVESGPLLTGQNPASAPPLAKALTRRLTHAGLEEASSDAAATVVGAEA